jgi:iron complex outermembrane receptor protein
MFFLVSGLVFCQFRDAHAKNSSVDLAALTIEELMDIEITSVSKKTQALSQAAAAVYVITPEDIRRSGVTSIPEALRMVPGLQVAHITGNKWAISARGFSDLFAKFLVVLIDGRNVYSPLFGGPSSKILIVLR